jgi:hypothetical protein
VFLEDSAGWVLFGDLIRSRRPAGHCGLEATVLFVAHEHWFLHDFFRQSAEKTNTQKFLPIFRNTRIKVLPINRRNLQLSATKRTKTAGMRRYGGIRKFSAENPQHARASGGPVRGCSKTGLFADLN